MSSTEAETKLSQRMEAQTESFSSLSVEQSAHCYEMTQTVSESSTTSWGMVEIEMGSISSLEMSSKSSFDIKVSASPKLLMEMSDVQVKTGEMAEFNCCFDGQPFTGVVWDHNGQSLDNTERVKRSQSGGLLTLVIQGVGVADQGTYHCTATNQYGYNSSSAQLTVEGG